MRSPIRKFISWLFRARQLALVSALALLLSTLALGISGSAVQAADAVTNVAGVAGNASVALSWTAPHSNLPLAFDTAANATVYHGGGGGDRDGNLDCPTDYAITGIATGAGNTSVKAR